jgi:hypothetical protein
MVRGMALVVLAAALIPQVKGKNGFFDFGRARQIRIGKVATLRKLRWSGRYHLRFFAARVPRRAAKVPRNKLVALDRRGRLLGRQHYRDKHGHYGRCDGLWDRTHCPNN